MDNTLRPCSAPYESTQSPQTKTRSSSYCSQVLYRVFLTSGQNQFSALHEVVSSCGGKIKTERKMGAI